MHLDYIDDTHFSTCETSISHSKISVKTLAVLNPQRTSKQHTAYPNCQTSWPV